MKTRTLAVILGLTLSVSSQATATPFPFTPVAGESDVTPVAKKRKKVTSRGPVLLGRVADIDRRERNTKNRRGGKLVGRVPARGRTQGTNGMDQFMQGMALGAVQALTGVGGGGGCGIDVTTPNPTGCGTRMGGGGGNNGLRPPYYCLVNGRKIVTNTFRAGCWMVSMDNRRLR